MDTYNLLTYIKGQLRNAQEFAEQGHSARAAATIAFTLYLLTWNPHPDKLVADSYITRMLNDWAETNREQAKARLGL